MSESDDEDLEPGSKLGTCLLIRILGAGGMATVWEAEHEGVRVAVKVTRACYADDEALRAMLLEEARLAALVDHPNVCRLLGVLDKPRPALVMELLEGCTLAQLLEGDGALAPADAASIAAHVARGLHAAHEARDGRGRLLGLVHRDISPSNVMLTPKGPKVIDFGIARARERAIQTSAGTLKGKLGYLAPEQITRQPVDRRTDLYALGIVLWEMLTGRRYFDARNEVEVLLLARSPRPRAPSLHAPKVSGELDALVLRALAPRPADRFQTADAMADALEGVLT